MSHDLSEFTDVIRALKQQHERANIRRIHSEEQRAAEYEIYLAKLNKVLSSAVEALIEGDPNVILVSPIRDSSQEICLRYCGDVSRFEYILQIGSVYKHHVSLVSIFKEFKDNKLNRHKPEIVYKDIYDEDKITEQVVKSLAEWYVAVLNSTR